MNYALPFIFLSISAFGQIPERIMNEWKMLTEGSGTWLADNKAYMSDNEPYDQYGVTWQWAIGKTSLTGRLFGLKEGKDQGTFWEFRAYYDPEDGKYKYMQFGHGGAVGKAAFQIVDDTHTTDIVTLRYPDGNKIAIKHETETKGNTQYSQSYQRNNKGEWEKRRYYVWVRG